MTERKGLKEQPSKQAGLAALIKHMSLLEKREKAKSTGIAMPGEERDYLSVSHS